MKPFYHDVLQGKSPKRGVYTLIIVGIIAIFILPALFTIKVDCLPSFKETGNIGDTINGIAGPFIALIAAVLTFLAFYIQVKANKWQLSIYKEQRKQFEIELKIQKDENEKAKKEEVKRQEKQDRIWRIERFEQRFYELIKLHTENTRQLKIETINGTVVENKSIFVEFYDELHCIFWIVKNMHDSLSKSKRIKIIYTNEELARLSYLLFYTGIGQNSDMVFEAMNSGSLIYEKEFIDAIKEYLQRAMKLNVIKYRYGEKKTQRILKQKIPILKGHISHLSHYYRHLFHTVKYVVEYDEEILSYSQKLSYLRILRAQLSEHEQTLLYYNAISGLGIAWINNKYFTRYKMIHNIPFPLTDMGIHPEIKFQNYIQENGNIFEWGIEK